MKVPSQRSLLKEKETRKAFRYYLWISLNILRDALKLNGEKEAGIILKFFLRWRFDEESSLFSLPAILTSPCLFVKTALKNIFYLLFYEIQNYSSWKKWKFFLPNSMERIIETSGTLNTFSESSRSREDSPSQDSGRTDGKFTDRSKDHVQTPI